MSNGHVIPIQMENSARSYVPPAHRKPEHIATFEPSGSYIHRLRPEQIEMLEQEFTKAKTLHNTDLELLAAEMGLNEKDVQSLLSCLYHLVAPSNIEYSKDTAEPEDGGSDDDELSSKLAYQNAINVATNLMTSMTYNAYPGGGRGIGGNGVKTRADECRRQCRNRAAQSTTQSTTQSAERQPASTHDDSGAGRLSDHWRYQPCPPCCVPPAPCPPSCSDFHLTTTEYYPANDANTKCRWDNATCYNEGNDQSGNFIKQWNRHCHFTTYRDGVMKQGYGVGVPGRGTGNPNRTATNPTRGTGGASHRGGQAGNTAAGHETGVFGTAYSRSCCRNGGETASGYSRNDIQTEAAAACPLIPGGRPLRECHRKVEKVYTKPLKCEPSQSSMNSINYVGGPNMVTTHPPRNPKPTITATLIDPSMLSRGSQLWWNQRNDNPNPRTGNNSQRITVATKSGGGGGGVNDKTVDTQHHRSDVEMPILFFRKPKDDQ